MHTNIVRKQGKENEGKPTNKITSSLLVSSFDKFTFFFFSGVAVVVGGDGGGVSIGCAWAWAWILWNCAKPYKIRCFLLLQIRPTLDWQWTAQFLCVKPLAKRMQREKKKHTDGNEIMKSYLRKKKWCLQSAKNRESSTGKRTVFCRIDSYGKIPKSNNSVEFAVNIFPKYIYQKQEQKKK